METLYNRRGNSVAYDAAVIGGGFYGLSLALLLRERMSRVVVLEKDEIPCRRASFVNQARIHNGYHYPRSLMTAVRARVSYSRFIADFPECVEDRFKKYYAIPWTMSKVTAHQFVQFCRRIGAPILPAEPEVKKLFNPDRIEEVFAVTECAFNAHRLRDAVLARAAERGVEVLCGVEAHRVATGPEDQLTVACGSAGGALSMRARLVFNCTYSQINRLLTNSGLPEIPLRHQLAELAMVRVPEHLREMGITVMDGPFFSVMPFPALGMHSLTHVRYTHHHEWSDGPERPYMNGDEYLQSVHPQTRFHHMVRDAARYVPSLAESRYEKSLFDVKTLLPRSRQNDSRPILLRNDPSLPGLYSVLGAKIDSVYDVQESIEALISREAVSV